MIGAAAASVAVTLGAVALYESGGRGLFVGQPAIQPSTNQVASVLAHEGVPSLLAVRVHADWCAASKRMMPMASQLQQQHGTDRVLFVDLDLTDEASRQQARFLAASLGLAERWKEEQWNAGELLILSASDGPLLARVGPDDSLDQVVAVVEQALHGNAG